MTSPVDAGYIISSCIIAIIALPLGIGSVIGMQYISLSVEE